MSAQNLVIFSIILLFNFKLSAKSWNIRENPILKVSKTLNPNLDSLPQSAEVSKYMGNNWTWPSKFGFISNRWAMQNPKKNKDRHDYRFFRESGLKNIDLGQLSPAEKFDLYLGNSKWKFTRFLNNKIKKMKNSRLNLEITYSEVSLNYQDPRPNILKGKSEYEIPFGSSDLKALLSANFLINMGHKVKLLGEICPHDFKKLIKAPENKISEIMDSRVCKGINPGSFHIMISNYLGIKDRGISLDLKRDKKLEIRPIIGFISTLNTPQKNSKGINQVEVTTYLKYLAPSGPSWGNTIPGERGYTILKYILELDKNGNITGGEWLSANRPDFMVIPSAISLGGIFKELGPKLEYDQTLENYRHKSLTQKLIIKDLLNRKQKISKKILEKMIGEYANTTSDYFKQKKKIKRYFRKVNTREVNTERDLLLKRLSGFKTSGKLQEFHQEIIEVANSREGNIFKKFLLLKSLHNKFINSARVEQIDVNYKLIGKMAFTQKKLINNYFKTSMDKRVDIDSLYLNFLLENSIFKRKEILNKTNTFLAKSESFLEGLTLESQFFKLNKHGRVFPKKGASLDKKIQDLDKGEPSYFKKISKKIILKNKTSKAKSWKTFLKPKTKRTIASIADSSPKAELKTYLYTKFESSKLKNIYTTNLFKISLATRKKKSSKIKNQKLINEALKKEILDEISVEKRNYTFTSYLLNSFREEIQNEKNTIFNDPKLEDIKQSLFTEYKQTLNKGDELNKNFLKTIQKGNMTSFLKLQKLGASASFQGVEGENAIMVATKFGQKKILKTLLDRNKKIINMENDHGQNALFLAVINANKLRGPVRIGIIEELLTAGINKNTSDKFGKIPKDYISDSGVLEEKIKKLLK